MTVGVSRRVQSAHAPSLHLPLYLAAAYTLLVIYASLHPFMGWRSSGESPAAFLFAAWPRYWTTFDLVTNTLAYLPLGFIWVPTLQPRYGRLAAVILATSLGCCLSLSLEVLQNFLPSRVASNLDIGSNSLGSLLGAIFGACWGATLLDGGRLNRLSHHLVRKNQAANSGLILITLWMLTQLNPETILFGNGDLRGALAILGAPEPLPYISEHFPWIEAGVTAGNTLAVGLLCGCLFLRYQRRIALGILTGALLIKSSAMTLLSGNVHLAWATPGSLMGLGAGMLLWWTASFLPRFLQPMIAAWSLMLAATLVNLTPENPYLSAILQVWQQGQGHFLNFNGLMRWTSSIWPFLALSWLMLPHDKVIEKHEPNAM